jgi:hypothetical protein
MKDMIARDLLGQERYGVRLHPFNGRDSLLDLTEELLDAIVYLRSFMEEIKWTGQQIKEVRDVLAGPSYVDQETAVELADSLTQLLKKNPAFHAL